MAGDEVNEKVPVDILINLYEELKWYVKIAGYEREIEEQERCRLSDVTDSTLLCQCAWVILTSGFKVEIVERIFPDIAWSFFGWQDVSYIAKRRSFCEKRALKVFNHKNKISAIGQCSEIITEKGAEDICASLTVKGPRYLEMFPQIGPVTSLHLAKNIGVDVAKPDRHLSRLAKGLGYRSVDRMCYKISRRSGDRKSTVDLVLWRFSTLVGDGVGVAQRLAGVR